MKEYQLDCGWKISFPDNWIYEYQEDDGQNVFYPPDSDLTVRITAFSVERHGKPAPIEVMEYAYVHTISTHTDPFNVDEYKLTDFSVKGFASEMSEDDQNVFVRSVGYYAPGELLSINIFGTSEEECNNALSFLNTLSFEKNNA